MKTYKCVSHEMAQMLKAAELPQLKLAAQHYYEDETTGEYWYAPTATELLAHLPDGWAVEKHGILFRVSRETDNSFYHENPHDAAALAWLHENKKEEQ